MLSIIGKYAKLLVMVTMMAGCASMADYDAAIAKDGSFAADDRKFAVNPLDYPVFALIGGQSKRDPEIGEYKWKPEMTTDILPSDRWEITRVVHGRYLAYSLAYNYRYCLEQGHVGWLYKCDMNGRLDAADFYKYLYINRDGSGYAWQQVPNNKRLLFKKTWFRVKRKGDWSGQPWFKCVERCDKLTNMK